MGRGNYQIERFSRLTWNTKYGLHPFAISYANNDKIEVFAKIERFWAVRLTSCLGRGVKLEEYNQFHEAWLVTLQGLDESLHPFMTFAGFPKLKILQRLLHRNLALYYQKDIRTK